MLSDNPIWLLCNNIWSVEELSLVRTKNVEENDAGLHLRKNGGCLKTCCCHMTNIVQIT